MAKINFAEVVEEICEKDLRYSVDAYHFVQEGLNYTLKSLKRAGQHAPPHRDPLSGSLSRSTRMQWGGGRRSPRSSAARRVNVIARHSSGYTSSSAHRYAIRWIGYIQLDR